MSESIPLTSTTSEEGSYAPPHNSADAGPASSAEHDCAEVKVTVAEKLVASGADPAPLKWSGTDGEKERLREERRGSESENEDSHPGWSAKCLDFDQTSTLFNFQDRRVRDAGWRYVFLVPLVLLLAVGLLSLVVALFSQSIETLFYAAPITIVLLAASVPLPALLIYSLRGLSARAVRNLIVAAAVICALLSAYFAVGYFAPPTLVSWDAVAAFGGATRGGANEMPDSNAVAWPTPHSGSEMGENATEQLTEDYSSMGADEVMGEGSVDLGTEEEQAELLAAFDEEGTESSENSGEEVEEDEAGSSSSSSTATTDLGRGLLELALPAMAVMHPVVTITSHHSAHWIRAVHSAVGAHRRLQITPLTSGLFVQSVPKMEPPEPGGGMPNMLPPAAQFILFVVFGLVSVLGVVLLLCYSSHLPLTASVVAHTAHTTIHRAPILLFMAFPVILLTMPLCVPMILIDVFDTAVWSNLLFLLPALIILFVVQVIATLCIYTAAAIFARVYAQNSSSSESSNESSGDVQAAAGEQGVTFKSQLALLQSSFTLACTSSLGTCCAVVLTAITISIIKFILSALTVTLLGSGALAGLVAAVLRCAELAGHFFLHCLVLPTSAISGQGFARSARLSLDLLQRYLVPIAVVNAAAAALLVMQAALMSLVYVIIFGCLVWGFNIDPWTAVFFVVLPMLVVYGFSLVALSYVLTTGVSTTVLCFAWDKRLDAEEGSDADGLVGGGYDKSELKNNIDEV